ncbi:HNH endonuclease signature motif containing protein [Aureimonas glaciei]
MPNRIGTPPKIADSFYLSPEWRGLMASIKRARGSQCEKCGAKGRVLGDHIREIKDGGAKLDQANVMLLCLPCHNVKTAKAKRARVRS